MQNKHPMLTDQTNKTVSVRRAGGAQVLSALQERPARIRDAVGCRATGVCTMQPEDHIYLCRFLWTWGGSDAVSIGRPIKDTWHPLILILLAHHDGYMCLEIYRRLIIHHVRWDYETFGGLKYGESLNFAKWVVGASNWGYLVVDMCCQLPNNVPAHVRTAIYVYVKYTY